MIQMLGYKYETAKPKRGGTSNTSRTLLLIMRYLRRQAFRRDPHLESHLGSTASIKYNENLSQPLTKISQPLAKFSQPLTKISQPLASLFSFLYTFWARSAAQVLAQV